MKRTLGVAVPAGVSEDGIGIVIGDGPVTVDAYPVLLPRRVRRGLRLDEGRFLVYAKALFAKQPPEGGPGLSDEDLVAIGNAVGLGGGWFAECVLSHSYIEWPTHVTEQATARGVNATPTTLVQGVPVPADAHTIAAAVAGATG